MRYLVFFCVALSGMAPSLAAQGSSSVGMSDGEVSIEADRVGLGELLDQLDAAAGTRSTVPSELESRVVSVRFRSLPLDQAIRKIFEGQSVDYAVVGGSQIVVLAQSRAGVPSTSERPVQPAPGGPTSQPPDLGTFQMPGRGAAATDTESVPAAPVNGRGGRGRGGRGAQQLAPGQPFSGAVNLNAPARGGGLEVPFGVPTAPLPGMTGGTAESVFGNPAPAILDLNGPPTPPDARPLPPALPGPPLPNPSGPTPQLPPN
jgi:hypothetical protein